MRKFLQSYVSIKHNFRQKETSLQPEAIKDTICLSFKTEREREVGRSLMTCPRSHMTTLKWFNFLVFSLELCQGPLKHFFKVVISQATSDFPHFDFLTHFNFF